MQQQRGGDASSCQGRARNQHAYAGAGARPVVCASRDLCWHRSAVLQGNSTAGLAASMFSFQQSEAEAGGGEAGGEATAAAGGCTADTSGVFCSS